MDIQQSKLDNGVRVVSINIPGQLTSYVAVYVNVGSASETKELNGISHFLEHMAFKGTTTRTEEEISKQTELSGTYANAFTSKFMTAYHMTSLPESVRNNLELLADIVRNSTFPEKGIEIERGVIQQEIKMYEDSPTDNLFRLFDNTYFFNQSRGRPIIGSAENVARFTQQDFIDYRNKYYNASNMIVVGAGAINHSEFLSMVTDQFGGMPTGTANKYETASFTPGAEYLEKRYEQTNVLVGLNTVPESHELSSAFSLLDDALGRGSSSPLFRKFRVERGLVYSVYSHAGSRFDYGNFLIGFGTTKDKVVESLDLIYDIISDSMKHITDDDITRAKNSSRMTTARMLSNPTSLVGDMIDDLFFKGAIEPITDKLDKFVNVTKEQLEAAANMLANSKGVLAMVGPMDQVDQTKVLSDFTTRFVAD